MVDFEGWEESLTLFCYLGVVEWCRNDKRMKTTCYQLALFLAFSLTTFALWSCNKQSEKRPFVTKWQGEAGQTLKIPVIGTYTLTWYNETNPDDRHTQQVTVGVQKNQYGDEEVLPYTFTTPTDGVYVVEAGPDGVDGIRMLFEHSYEKFASKLLAVKQFGDVVWKRLDSAFLGCENMQFEVGIDTPNLSQCSSLAGMFSGCEAFNSSIERWDVSRIKNMSALFNRCVVFNQPLEKWDVSQVENMENMFNFCESFNRPLNQWNVGRVTNMGNMFLFCESFNHPLDHWNVSQVTDMTQMFDGCVSFDQSLEAWNVSRVDKKCGMKGIFNQTPTASALFVMKWETEGYDLQKECQ